MKRLSAPGGLELDAGDVRRSTFQLRVLLRD